MRIAVLDEILNLLDEVLELGARHLDQGARVLGQGLGRLGLGVLAPEVGNGVEHIGVVGVETLYEGGVDLDLLELIAVGEVSVPLELVVEEGQFLVDELTLPLPLRLGRRRGGGDLVGCHDGGNKQSAGLGGWRCVIVPDI